MSSSYREQWLSKLPFEVGDMVKVSENAKYSFGLGGKIGKIIRIRDRMSNYRAGAVRRFTAEFVVLFNFPDPNVPSRYREQGFLVECDQPKESWDLEKVQAMRNNYGISMDAEGLSCSNPYLISMAFSRPSKPKKSGVWPRGLNTKRVEC